MERVFVAMIFLIGLVNAQWELDLSYLDGELSSTDYQDFSDECISTQWFSRDWTCPSTERKGSILNSLKHHTSKSQLQSQYTSLTWKDTLIQSQMLWYWHEILPRRRSIKKGLHRLGSFTSSFWDSPRLKQETSPKSLYYGKGSFNGAQLQFRSWSFLLHHNQHNTSDTSLRSSLLEATWNSSYFSISLAEMQKENQWLFMPRFTVNVPNVTQNIWLQQNNFGGAQTKIHSKQKQWNFSASWLYLHQKTPLIRKLFSKKDSNTIWIENQPQTHRLELHQVWNFHSAIQMTQNHFLELYSQQHQRQRHKMQIQWKPKHFLLRFGSLITETIKNKFWLTGGLQSPSQKLLTKLLWQEHQPFKSTLLWQKQNQNFLLKQELECTFSTPLQYRFISSQKWDHPSGLTGTLRTLLPWVEQKLLPPTIQVQLGFVF